MGTDILPDSLPVALRESTLDLHRIAESHPAQGAILKGGAPFSLFLDQSSQMWLVQTAMDRTLVEHRGAPPLASLVKDYHLRATVLEADLVACGRDPALISPLRATRNFLANLDRGHANPLILVGILYVLEGSTNGGRLIAKIVQRAYSRPDDLGMRWLDPHGSSLTERWRLFREGLADLKLDADQHAAVIRAARDTFEWVIGVLDELGDRYGIRPA